MMFTRRSTLLAALAAAPLFSALSFSAASADTVKFSQAAFADATKAGKSVLVDVAASWCPTCKAQHPIINELTSSDAYKKFVVFEVDFDSQLDALRAFRVQKQSTLIVFKGETETGRSVGQTSKDQIAELLDTAK